VVLVVLRRVCVVFVSGVLAVLGVLVVPPAGAQDVPPPALAYTVKASADVSQAQNGDPVRITVSGLPAGGRVTLKVCPAEVPNTLLKGVGPAVPQPDLTIRVNAYCQTLNDELVGAQFGAVDRGRSQNSKDVVFDTSIPRGSSIPGYVTFDPDYTSFNVGPAFPWANNPIVSTSSDGTPIRARKYSFTCDETHPCRFALNVKGTVDGKVLSAMDTSIKFAPTAPGLTVKGCGGLGASTLDATMPERFGETAVSWNQLLCAPTHADQPTNIVGENEDEGLKSFDTGDADIAFTGSGSALAEQTVRSREYVPVGLNAAVIAAVGWSPTDKDDGNAALISQVRSSFSFTFDEVADMLSKGGETPDADGRGGIFQDGSALVQRNAAMAAVVDGRNPANVGLRAGARAGVDSAAGFFGVTGEAGKGSVPLTLSTVLGQSAPRSWLFPDRKANYGELAGKTPGAITALEALDPGGNPLHNVDAKVGRLAVRKVVNNATLGTGSDCSGGCLNWVVTDLATATDNGWTPVALPNGRGGFVSPNAQSLQAAANTMTQSPDGTLRPGTATDPDAYPLTFAEYLAAPVNPLVDKACVPQQAKQEQLKTFLRVAQNGGQSAMSAGMVPLTPELLGLAGDRAARIGTGTADAACQEQEVASNPPPLAGDSGNTATPVSDSTTPLGGTAPPAATAAPATTAAPTPATVLAAKNLADSVRIPSFPGAGALGVLVPLLALVILAALPSATAYATAGRPAPSWLTKAMHSVATAATTLVSRRRYPSSVRGEA